MVKIVNGFVDYFCNIVIFLFVTNKFEIVIEFVFLETLHNLIVSNFGSRYHGENCLIALTKIWQSQKQIDSPIAQYLP